MRKAILFLIAAALVLTAVWLFARRPGVVNVPSPSGAATERPISPGQLPDQGAQLMQPNTTAPGGITQERKRLILQAAFACRRADRFREGAKATGGPSVANPEASLSTIQRENMKKADAECSADPAARTAPVEDFLLDLARNGNAAAAACYVSGMFREHKFNELLPDDPRYRQVVPQLVERGIAAGDWTMVALAASINRPRNAASLYIHLPQPDPKLELFYARLKMLGASDAEKTDMQLIVAELEQGLSSTDRKNAEARAEAIFRDHFSQSGPSSRGGNPVCRDF